MYQLLRPCSMAILLNCLRLLQLSATTQPQVYHTYPVGSIFYQVFVQRRFNELIQLDTSFMDVMVERFEGIVSSHGGTQK